MCGAGGRTRSGGGRSGSARARGAERGGRCAATRPGGPEDRAGRGRRRRGRAGSSSRTPDSGVTWSTMPPTAEATTGRDFHMASVTVRPKPSCMLFWTTTLAWRWVALTASALRPGRPWGARPGGWRHGRRAGRASQAPRHSASTRAPSGSSVTPSTAGPTRASRASVRPGHVLGETVEDADHVLQVVPPRDLDHDPARAAERRGTAQDGVAPGSPPSRRRPDAGQELGHTVRAGAHGSSVRGGRWRGR